MKKNGAKPIEPGEIFWFTYEHIYTQEGEILPRVEYCVLSGEFRKFVMGGKEMVVVGKTPDRGNVPLITIIPGLFIFVTALSVNIISDGLKDAMEANS